MAQVYPARAADTSLTIGLGPVVVSGIAPDDNMRTFNEVMEIGDTVYLGIANREAAEWEEGRYTYVGVDRLARTEIFQSSSDGAPVNFTAGIKDVWALTPTRTIRRADQAIVQVGIAEVDFGAFPGTPDASIDVTGLAEITEDSIVLAHVTAVETDDHSADEHWIDPPIVVAGNVVANQGFTIYATGGNFYGKYSVAWAIR